jgi:hypothetical protein
MDNTTNVRRTQRAVLMDALSQFPFGAHYKTEIAPIVSEGYGKIVRPEAINRLLHPKKGNYFVNLGGGYYMLKSLLTPERLDVLVKKYVMEHKFWKNKESFVAALKNESVVVEKDDFKKIKCLQVKLSALGINVEEEDLLNIYKKCNNDIVKTANKIGAYIKSRGFSK